MTRMKIELSMSYDYSQSYMDEIRDAVRRRVEGMLELGDFNLLDEEDGVQYPPRGWEVSVVWEEIPTPPVIDVSADDRSEPDTLHHQRVHSPVGQELAMNFSWTSDKEKDKENAMREETHGQERAKGTGEET